MDLSDMRYVTLYRCKASSSMRRLRWSASIRPVVLVRPTARIRPVDPVRPVARMLEPRRLRLRPLRRLPPRLLRQLLPRRLRRLPPRLPRRPKNPNLLKSSQGMIISGFLFGFVSKQKENGLNVVLYAIHQYNHIKPTM